MWKTIDSAPKDTDVLVYCGEDGMTVARLLGDGSWSLAQYGPYAEDGSLDSTPTHWMELPEGPK